MIHAFSRTELLIGAEGLDKLKHSKVAVFGIGGVGSYVVEALARCGVGHLVLIDDDDICLSNVNRQIHATQKTVGQSKVQIMKERVLDINPEAEVITFKEMYTAQTADKLLSDDYDYVVDAIDMVTSKLDLIKRCKERNIRIMSAMGAANKMDPTKLEVADIYKTSECPLAKVMRHELKRMGIKKLKVVYSKEKAIKPIIDSAAANTPKVPEPGSTKIKRQTPGSIAFVPSVAGLIIAGEVVKDLIDYKSQK